MIRCHLLLKAWVVLAVFLFVWITGTWGASSQAQYDVVILNGRVMDPETGLDLVRNVAIRNGKVVAISTALMEGRETINARGLVVSPGFIDLHQHSQTDEAY